LAFDAGSGGPVIDQFGRCSDPAYFAAGNVLRAVETAGWCGREGLDIADYIADDLEGGLPPLEEVEIVAGPGLKYVVPQRLSLTAPLRARLQLRVSGPATGHVQLRVGAAVVYRRAIATLPERRVTLDLSGLRLALSVRRIDVEIVP
jgi:hypothetical protein